MSASDRISGLGQGGAKKGTVVVADGTGWQALPPGTTNQVLTIDPTQATGVKWAAGGGGGGIASVGLSMPAEFSVANSPLTADGTIAVTRANQNANVVMAGPTTGAAAAPTFRALVAADIPVTGLTITQWTSPIQTATDGATVTFDLATGNRHKVTLGGNRTLALSNPGTDQPFQLYLYQDATGSRTVTWFSTIRWSNGAVPTLATGANKVDVFLFIPIGGGTYLGSLVLPNA